jgi:hypothetical protein
MQWLFRRQRGARALSELLGRLPQNFPSPIFVVQPLNRNHNSAFVEGLARRTSLGVRGPITESVDFVLPLETLAAALIALTMAPGAADFLQAPLAAA